MTSEDIRISKQFCKFCLRVLKNEAINFHRETTRQRNRIKSLNELTGDEIIKLSVCDNYFNNEHIFKVLDKEIVVMGNALANAIRELPQHKRDIILLSYFAGLNDREIGEELGAKQQTISYRRISSLKKLKELLEKEGFEWLNN